MVVALSKDEICKIYFYDLLLFFINHNVSPTVKIFAADFFSMRGKN